MYGEYMAVSLYPKIFANDLGKALGTSQKTKNVRARG